MNKHQKNKEYYQDLIKTGERIVNVRYFQSLIFSVFALGHSLFLSNIFLFYTCAIYVLITLAFFYSAIKYHYSLAIVMSYYNKEYPEEE